MGYDERKYEYKNNLHYIKFTEQKEAIKKKYPPRIFELHNNAGRSTKYIENLDKEYILNDRSLHQEYLKELADLIFQNEGEFQQLTWDMMGEVESLKMERLARGRYTGTGEYH